MVWPEWVGHSYSKCFDCTSKLLSPPPSFQIKYYVKTTAIELFFIDYQYFIKYSNYYKIILRFSTTVRNSLFRVISTVPGSYPVIKQGKGGNEGIMP
jgi:hypothetical protein